MPLFAYGHQFGRSILFRTPTPNIRYFHKRAHILGTCLTLGVGGVSYFNAAACSNLRISGGGRLPLRALCFCIVCDIIVMGSGLKFRIPLAIHSLKCRFGVCVAFGIQIAIVFPMSYT